MARALVLAFACALAAASRAHAVDLGDVDPLIGTAGPGQTVPGPQLPFGFANPSPDTTRQGTSGYNPGGRIVGFSQTHVSGTGGASRYGNFRMTPFNGGARGAAAFSGEQASPGYYAVTLAPSGIRAELTATRLVAVHRYSFPAGGRPQLALDVGSGIHSAPASQIATSEWARPAGRRELDGGGTFKRGWGLGSYRLYFAALADSDAAIRVTRHGRAVKATLAFSHAGPLSAVLKVGLSFRSAADARRNAVREVPSFDFDGVRAQAQAAWAAALAKISVSGGDAAERRTFATALYHSELMPHDLTGENVWVRSRRPHYEDYYALWDTFRTQHPLLRLIEPAREAAMVDSLVAVAGRTGWLPDARIAGNNGLTQVGSNGEVMIADAFASGLPGFDRRAAHRAVIRDATVNSPRWIAQGRLLKEYARRGYIATDERASASRTLEYAYDDFAAAEVASALGDRRHAARLRARSLSWTRLWDRKTRTVRPRTQRGGFVRPFDPSRVVTGWHVGYYEGSAYQYSTYVPHDAQGLINRLGGDRAATAWLDAFFTRRRGGYTPANEHDLLAPYLYIHAGRPDRTDARVRALLAASYAPTRHGLPGNDDSGALSSWYVWGAIGLYPNAGQPYYYIGAPLFTRTSIDLGGRTFTVLAPSASDAARYVVAASLNGRPLCRAYLTSPEVLRGGTLELTLAAAPNGWGRCRRPPSLERRR